MNRRRLCLVFAIIVTSWAAASYSQTRGNQIQQPSLASAPTGQRPAAADPWRDWLVVQENQHVPVVDQRGRDFQQARESFLKLDFQTAAQKTREAAGFLAEQLNLAPEKDRQKISAVLVDLNRLAQQLDRQAVESLDQVDAVFVRAHQADMEHSWALIGAEHWRPLAAAPEAHFRLADQAFHRKDFKAAATEIRKAVGLLKLEDTRRTPDRQELASSVRALSQLADQVEKDSAGIPDLNTSFATAEYALAESHCSNALSALAEQQLQATGHELQAGVLDLAQGAEWAAHGAEFDSSLVVSEALALSQQLIEGQTKARAAITHEIKSVESEIASLNKGLHEKLAPAVSRNHQSTP